MTFQGAPIVARDDQLTARRIVDASGNEAKRPIYIAVHDMLSMAVEFPFAHFYNHGRRIPLALLGCRVHRAIRIDPDAVGVAETCCEDFDFLPIWGYTEYSGMLSCEIEVSIAVPLEPSVVVVAAC